MLEFTINSMFMEEKPDKEIFSDFLRELDERGVFQGEAPRGIPEKVDIGRFTIERKRTLFKGTLRYHVYSHLYDRVEASKTKGYIDNPSYQISVVDGKIVDVFKRKNIVHVNDGINHLLQKEKYI